MRRGAVLLSFSPLLHLRGKRFEYDVILAFLKEGAEMRAVAWYDNSPNNPHNPNPNASVNWGDQPRDEVLGGFFDVAVPATIGDGKILVRHHLRN